MIGLVAAVPAAIVAVPAAAQSTCDRDMLMDVGNRYVEAQRTGSTVPLPRGQWVVYNENFKRSSMTFGGVIATPLEIDWHRVIADDVACSVYVEVIAANAPHPYVLGTTFQVRGGNVNNFEVTVTDEGDWLFDAAKTLDYARREEWGIIPEDRRDTRETLKAAADAYLDYFKDKSVEVPWGTPCARLEGGIYTGRGRPDDSCAVGVPEGIDLARRSYVIDPVVGAVAVQLRFGGPEGLPDVHAFRIEDGRIRYIHTITNCGEQANCGFPPLEQMIADNPDMQPDLDK